MSLSVVVVAHNEGHQLAHCLESLFFADEIVVVLDRCSDDSFQVASRFTNNIIQGAWHLEGDRRNQGIVACNGTWILEVDCDERIPKELAREIGESISKANPGYFLIPFDNYVGDRLIKHGWGASWGVSAAPRLFSKGSKVWGQQRVHPSLKLIGQKRSLHTPIVHLLDRDISDMLLRLDRYTTARALDLRDMGDIGKLSTNIRRMASRFWKCYVMRKGYREGAWGFLIALMAGLYPIISHLKARLEVR